MTATNVLIETPIPDTLIFSPMQWLVLLALLLPIGTFLFLCLQRLSKRNSLVLIIVGLLTIMNCGALLLDTAYTAALWMACRQTEFSDTRHCGL